MDRERARDFKTEWWWGGVKKDQGCLVPPPSWGWRWSPQTDDFGGKANLTNVHRLSCPQPPKFSTFCQMFQEFYHRQQYFLSATANKEPSTTLNLLPSFCRSDKWAPRIMKSFIHQIFTAHHPPSPSLYESTGLVALEYKVIKCRDCPQAGWVITQMLQEDSERAPWEWNIAWDLKELLGGE